MEFDPVLTYEEVYEYLNGIAEGLPAGLYTHLNGGILLQQEALLSPYALQDDLHTLGQYTHAPSGLGRYITIYYGSFEKIALGKSTEDQKNLLREVLLHEFTHHLENLAGLKDLEIEDARLLERYFQHHRK